MASVPSSTRVIVNHKFADDHHVPHIGEFLVVRLSEDLVGPGSALASLSNLPSRATRYNFYHAVLMGFEYSSSGLQFTVLPTPAYSGVGSLSDPTSSSWLLSQPADFQHLHIPLPFEEAAPSEQAQPRFPTPIAFGQPLKVGGWKDKRPRWVLAVPQVVALKTTTLVCIISNSSQLLLRRVINSSNALILQSS
jgi:hypothetical protein